MARIVAWALLVVALVLGAFAAEEHQQINKQREQQIAVVHDTITKDSAVYVRDTISASNKRRAYEATVQPIRIGVMAGGAAPSLNVVVAKADIALAADSSALRDCARLLASKDSLTTLLTYQPPTPPRLQYFVEPLYSLTDKAPVVQGGALFHLFGNWSLVGQGFVGPHSGASIGAHITF